jgi:hypothetical protein
VQVRIAAAVLEIDPDGPRADHRLDRLGQGRQVVGVAALDVGGDRNRHHPGDTGDGVDDGRHGNGVAVGIASRPGHGGA